MATSTKHKKPAKPLKATHPAKKQTDNRAQKKYIDKKIAAASAALAPAVITPDMMPFKVQVGESVQDVLDLNSTAFMNWVFTRVAQRAAGAGGLYDDLGDRLILMLTHKLVPSSKGQGDKPPELRGTPKEQMRLLQRVMDTIGTPDAQFTEVKVSTSTGPRMDIGPRPDLAPARSAGDDEAE